MVYKFNDLFNSVVLNSTSVMLVTGPYAIFNNIVIDQLKHIAKGNEEDDLEETFNIMSEFSQSTEDKNRTLALNFDEFMENCMVPAINGKWFCSVDFSILTEKQKKKLEEYIKKPSEYGILVIVMTKWKEYMKYIKNRVITANKESHLIQLSFPTRKILREIVKSKFNDKSFEVEDRAVDLFIMRMSTAYDDYDEVIDDICIKDRSFDISYDKMVEHLKNVNNYVLDDFIAQLLVPVKSKKIVKRRKIYKMYGFLRESMSASKLVSDIKYKVEDMIEFRMAINNGKIPVLVRYSVDEVKTRIDENSKLKKMNTYTFKRSAYIASQTTLRDWYYMKMILCSVKGYDESSYDRVLIGLIHRGVYSCDRLANLMGISNVLEENLFSLNGVFFNPYIRRSKDSIAVGDTLINYETGEIIEDIDDKDKSIEDIEDEQDSIDNLALQAIKIQEMINNQKE